MGRLTHTTTRVGSASPAGTGLQPAYTAVRSRLALVSVLLALAGLGWWWTIRQMRGMDRGPWSELGTFGWFISVWVVMMAAMMFPSVAPTVALYSRMSRARGGTVAFVTGYLATWAGAGVVAFVIGVLGRRVVPDLQWSRADRILTGGTLLLAAAYEVSPLKNVCLGRCRSPLGLLLGSWHDGRAGALRMGMTNGAWCVGCCWALMASLFALGIMSPLWMAAVALLIALEKLLPWPRGATYGTAGLLVVLGVLVLTAPQAVPGLTVPDPDPMPMSAPAR